MNPAKDRIDDATDRRLARLATMPVDTTILEEAIEAAIPRPLNPIQRIIRWQPARVAAGIAVMLLLAGIIIHSLSGGAVLALPQMMAMFHQQMIDGAAGSTPIQSIEQANQQLAEQFKNGTVVPQIPVDHVMMCCMRSIQDKKVACVLMQSSGVPITMAVAKAVDMRIPDSEKIIRGGREYHLQSSGNLNMIMTERDEHWICLIGALPSDDLINLAGGIQF